MNLETLLCLYILKSLPHESQSGNQNIVWRLRQGYDAINSWLLATCIEQSQPIRESKLSDYSFITIAYKCPQFKKFEKYKNMVNGTHWLLLKMLVFFFYNAIFYIFSFSMIIVSKYI